MWRFILLSVLLGLTIVATGGVNEPPADRLALRIVEPNDQATWFLGHHYRVVVKIQPALTTKTQASLWINGAVVNETSVTGDSLMFVDLDPLTLLRVGENSLQVRIKDGESNSLTVYRFLPHNSSHVVKHG